MKKLCSVFICISILLSSVIFAIPTSATAPDQQTVEEQQLAATETYYYDRLSDYQQQIYVYLKDLYVNLDGELARYRMDVSQYVLEAYAGDAYKLIHDFACAEGALFADDPYYDLRWKVAGAYVDDYSGEIPVCILEFICKDIDTEDNIAQIDARINQIVNAIGDGDRYTKLYKLAHFFISNTFYDPYLDEINMEGNDETALATRGIFYNTEFYGIFLKNIAICSGFAVSVKLLCNELDIPCIIMGNNKHAWNLVQMEDGSWYRFDMTNAVSLGWDGERNFDDYIENDFLNNNAVGAYDTYKDPYMFSSTNGVTEFPEHAEERYEYTGSTTDFSYTMPPSEYVPPEPKFVYKVTTALGLEEKTCTIINYEGRQEGDLVIPEEIDGYKVTNIAPYAFYYCTGFDGKLVLPDTLTNIERAAFAGCYNLTSVEFSDNLSSIGEAAFIGCKGLTELTLPDSLLQIDQLAFFDCTSLEAVRMGEHIQGIGDYALGFANNYRTHEGLTIYAPDESVSKEYASDNDIDFSVQGVQCDFVDDDGEWEFLGERHFHTCSHGVKVDVTEHSHDLGVFNCGYICNVCSAQYCITYGFMESVETIKDASPATCISPEFTGDIWCLCGETQLGFGEYIGDTIPHTPVSEELFSDEYAHWQLCECGQQLNYVDHYGGTATTTELAKCEGCGVGYGEMLHAHSPIDDSWISTGGVHYQLCECGRRLNAEAHYGGTATTTELALCEVCGAEYGELLHSHTPISDYWDRDGHTHWQLCECGERLNEEAHYGGTATDTRLAVCEVCGEEHGELKQEHTPIPDCWDKDEHTHWQLCECGARLNEEAHYGGTATFNKRAICAVCGTKYGELAKPVTTEATVTTATAAASTAPQTEAETTSANSAEGCEAVLGMGSVSAVALCLASFICFRKKED